MTFLCQMRFQIWTITREEVPSSGYSAGAFVNLIIDDGHVACTRTFDVSATSGSCCTTDADGDTAQAVAQGALVPPTTPSFLADFGSSIVNSPSRSHL
jgi:hypothetical protein